MAIPVAAPSLQLADPSQRPPAFDAGVRVAKRLRTFGDPRAALVRGPERHRSGGQRICHNVYHGAGPVLTQDVDLTADVDAAGVSPGSEFRVNTTTAGEQELFGITGGNAIATDAAGN